MYGKYRRDKVVSIFYLSEDIRRIIKVRGARRKKEGVRKMAFLLMSVQHPNFLSAPTKI